MPQDDGAIFLWKGEVESEEQSPIPPSVLLIRELQLEEDEKNFSNLEKFCPYCGSRFHSFEPDLAKYSTKSAKPRSLFGDGYKCKRCGFWYEGINMSIYSFKVADIKYSLLKKFNINDSAVGLSDLGSHLKRKFSDIYNLDPRKFEELVADVYLNMGYHVRLTQQTKDGGLDMVLLEGGSGEQIIVECKRYSRSRKVGIDVVRNFIGAKFLYEVDNGPVKGLKIVTSGHFSSQAIADSQKVTNHYGSFEIELVDADRLMKNIEVYNNDLPPLDIALKRKYE